VRESAVVDRHVNQNGRGSVMARAPRTHRADWTLGDPPALGDDSPVDVWTEKLSRSDRALRRHEPSVTFHGKSRALSSSSTAVMIELRIASTIDEFVTHARTIARGNEYDLEVVATHQ